jgi:hypothetical protein
MQLQGVTAIADNADAVAAQQTGHNSSQNSGVPSAASLLQVRNLPSLAPSAVLMPLLQVASRIRSMA